MPLAEAMETQRAVRRLLPDPVDDDIVLRVLELATKAPTGSNLQSWEFVVVRDPDVKHQLARLNRQAWSIYRRLGKRRARGHEPTRARSSTRCSGRPTTSRRSPSSSWPASTAGHPCSARRCSPRAATAPPTRPSRTCCWRPGPSAWAPPSPPSRSGRPPWPAAPSGSRHEVTPVAVVPMGWPQGRLRSHHPQTGGRSGPSRPVRESALPVSCCLPRTARAAAPRCGRMKGHPGALRHRRCHISLLLQGR